MDNNKTGTFWQAVATIVIWVMVTGGIALGGVFLAPQLGEEVLGFFFMLLAAAVVCTGFVWKWGQLPGGENQKKGKQKNEDYLAAYDSDYDEKRKRDRLGAALRTLSDDELVRLRERIARGEIAEEDLASVLNEIDRR
jgi:hypothetical protein